MAKGSGSALQVVCVRGHDMSISRHRTPLGDTYCNECRREDYRNSNLKRKYRLTVEDFNRLVDEQGGVCPICGGVPEEVDHDHACCAGSKTCGKCIRAVLCKNCNRALGHAHDDPKTLRALAVYVEEFSRKKEEGITSCI